MSRTWSISIAVCFLLCACVITMLSVAVAKQQHEPMRSLVHAHLSHEADKTWQKYGLVPRQLADTRQAQRAFLRTLAYDPQRFTTHKLPAFAVPSSPLPSRFTSIDDEKSTFGDVFNPTWLPHAKVYLSRFDNLATGEAGLVWVGATSDMLRPSSVFPVQLSFKKQRYDNPVRSWLRPQTKPALEDLRYVARDEKRPHVSWLSGSAKYKIMCRVALVTFNNQTKVCNVEREFLSPLRAPVEKNWCFWPHPDYPGEYFVLYDVRQRLKLYRTVPNSTELKWVRHIPWTHNLEDQVSALRNTCTFTAEGTRYFIFHGRAHQQAIYLHYMVEVDADYAPVRWTPKPLFTERPFRILYCMSGYVFPKQDVVQFTVGIEDLVGGVLTYPWTNIKRLMTALPVLPKS